MKFLITFSRNYYSILHLHRFYRAMHFSAKRGIAIACRLSLCPVENLCRPITMNASWCDMNMHHIRRRRRRGNNTTKWSV